MPGRKLSLPHFPQESSVFRSIPTISFKNIQTEQPFIYIYLIEATNCEYTLLGIYLKELRTIQYIRLKAAINEEQIHDRLLYQPEIMELHLTEKNLYHPQEIVHYIRLLKARGIRVYLHHPMKHHGRYLDIISSSPEMRQFYNWSSELIASICKQENIKCIIHCHYSDSDSSRFADKGKRYETRKRIEEILHICDQSFLWEDTTEGIFSAQNPHLLDEIVRPLHLPLNIDISHTFIALQGNNRALEQHLKTYASYANYFHLVDSLGVEHDSLPLGRGNINWAMVKPFVGDTDFIFEIDLSESQFLDCRLMIESAEYFSRI